MFRQLVSTFFQQLWKFFTEPFESLQKTERRLAIVSAIFFLISIIGALLEEMVGGRTQPIVPIILLMGYLLARTRWYKAAMLVLIVSLSFPSYLVALTVSNPNPSVINNSFIWIILPLILSSLFYSVRTTFLFSTANIVLISILPFIREDLTLFDISGSIGFYLMVAVFVIAVMVQRNQIEKLRQEELLESRNQLAEEASQRKKFAEQAQRRADQLVMLNEVGRVVSSLQELENSLDLIFNQVKRQIPLDIFYVALYDEDTDMVSFPIVFDDGRKWDEKPAKLNEAPLISHVIQSRQSLFWNQTEAEMRDSASGKLLGDHSQNSASILITPLNLGDRVAGVISAQSYAMNVYNEEHLMLLNAISQQIAIAIENTHLFEQTKKRAQRLAILDDIGKEISTLSDLPTLMENVYQQVNKALSTDLFFIGLYDKEKNELAFPIMYDDRRRWEQRSNPVTDFTFSGKAILTQKPFLIDEWSASANDYDSTLTIVGDDKKITKSLMFAPMLFGTETIGVISVQSYRPHAYNEEDLSLLSGIANQVAIAIQNTRLLEETKQNAVYLSTLNELGRVVSELRDLPNLLEVIYEKVKQNLNVDAFYVGLHKPDNNTVIYPIMYDEGIRYHPEPDILSPHSFMHHFLHGEKATIILRTEDELNLTPGEMGMLGNFAKKSASLLIAPLKVGEKVIGMISAQSYTLNAYTENDLKLLIGIGNQVGVAIQNTLLVEELKQNTLYLSALNELGRVVSELRDLPDLLEVIYRQVKLNLNVDAFLVGLYEPETQTTTYPIMYDEGIRYDIPPQAITPNNFIHDLLHGGSAKLIHRTEDELKPSPDYDGMAGNVSKKSASLLIAPLKTGEQVIGMISAQSYEMNAYTEDDLNLLVGVGNQVGVAIQNARLLEEVRRNAQQLSILNEVGRAASKTLDLFDLLEAIYQQVQQNLRADTFFVSLYHPENNMVSYPLIYDEGVQYTLASDFLLEYSFLHKFIHGEHATLILRTEDELAQKPGEQGTIGDESKKSASLMYAPLKVGEQVIGMISVQSYTLNAYTEDDLNLLVGIGNQVGVAIQNARLLEEVKQNAEHLSILNEVGRAVSKIMDLPDLLEVVYEQGKKSISLDAFFVGLYHPEVDEVSFPIMYDSGMRYEQTRGVVSKNSFLRRFLNGEKSILMLRTEEELAEGITYQKMLGKDNKMSASLMAAPLISRDQVIGLISAQSYTLNAYDESDLKLLEGIANQVSIAIENSRLYTSAQEEIKERERVEMDLQRERDFAVQVMNTLGQGVAVSMLDGVYEYVNPAYAHMLGYKPEDMIDKPSEHFAIPEEVDAHSKQRKQRQLGETTTYETRLRHKDGHIIHALVTGVPRYLNGRIIGSISAITDLTERKRAEMERENLITEMEAKNAELERFTYTVSHDLKSPLVTIGGFVGFLEADIKKGDYDRIPRTASRIREAAKKMQRLLNELLELSRIGRIANPSQEIPFGELVSETLELMDGQLREKQVEVQVDAEFPIVHVDRVRMQEVIQNLVANAVKFMGDQKSPKIRIGTEVSNGENIFFIKDNGIGIESEFHDRIFGLFNKLDQSTEGTGIGLAVVKRIIEVHGGRIWVESEPGKGATFFFTLKN